PSASSRALPSGRCPLSLHVALPIYVGVIRVVGHFNRFAGLEQVCHAGRVVLVHLAAVGFDEQLLGHGSHVVWCVLRRGGVGRWRSEEHTSELQSREKLVCRLLLEKK